MLISLLRGCNSAYVDVAEANRNDNKIDINVQQLTIVMLHLRSDSQALQG